MVDLHFMGVCISINSSYLVTLSLAAIFMYVLLNVSCNFDMFSNIHRLVFREDYFLMGTFINSVHTYP